MTPKELYEFARNSRDKTVKRKEYNRLIEMYNAETGSNIERLSSCGSCIKQFESYKPFREWITSK
jgi:hypothetical protein